MEENKTKEELIKEQEILKSEVERLQKIIDASSETTFEIIIEDLKKQMIENVEAERWTAVKNCIKEVDSVNGTKNFIEKQSSLLTKKEEELEEITAQIENYQPSLFDSTQEETENEAIETGIKYQSSMLVTGDIYKSRFVNNTTGDYSYYLIKKSSEKEGSFAMISNSFEGERLLQYPKNVDLLDFTYYEGNIFIDDDDKEKALQGLKIIEDKQVKQCNDAANQEQE